MGNHSEKLESLADNLKNQHNDVNVDNALHFLRVSGLFENYLNVEFRKTGLNRTQIIILHFLLARGGTITPTEVKRIAFRSNNAISKSLDSLDKLGLTRSSKSKRDRRQRKVVLTPQGLELLEKLLPVRRHLFSQAMSCLNQEDAEALRSILSQLENHMGSITEKLPESKKQKILF